MACSRILAFIFSLRASTCDAHSGGLEFVGNFVGVGLVLLADGDDGHLRG